jgi:RNA polymerase sigma-70 factor (ECF subfamily)
LDSDLVRRAQQGDQEAFGILARATAGRLFWIARRILRDFDRAEDAVQETLVIAWRELPRLRDPERFEPWLHRTLVRVCYADEGRTRRLVSSIRVLPAREPVAVDDSKALADRDQLERGFRRLPPEQRAILVLHHYLGLGPDEIAETLGIPAGTARSRLHYAHRAMRAALEADTRREVAQGHRA